MSNPIILLLKIAFLHLELDNIRQVLAELTFKISLSLTKRLYGEKVRLSQKVSLSKFYVPIA